MRLYRNAIILIVFLGLLVGGYFYVSKLKVDEGQKDNTDVEVMKYNKDDIKGVTVVNKDVKYVLEKQGDKYVLTYPEKVNYNKYLTAAYIDKFTNMTAFKFVDITNKNAKDFGLGSPALIDINFKDGKVKTFEVGDYTATKSGIYARFKDENKVYILSTGTGEELKIGKDYFTEKTLYTDVEKKDLKTITLYKDNKLVFTLKSQGKDKWMISEPLGAEPVTDKVNGIVDAIPPLSVFNFVEDEPKDLGKYGLANPKYMLDVTSTKGNVKIYIGDDNSDRSETYAKWVDKNKVFTISTGYLGFLDTSLKDLLEKLIYVPDITDVNEFDVTMDGHSDVFTIKHDPKDKEKDQYFVNGKQSTAKDSEDYFIFKKYYQALISIVFTDLDIGAVPKGKPEITFTYKRNKAPDTVKVEFIPKDEFRYYAVVNGKYGGYLVNKKDFDKPESVREMYGKLMKSIK